MDNNQGFDVIIGKLPRQDKEGKDVTGDRIGRGGRHREDGTYSSVVYDIQIFDKGDLAEEGPADINPANQYEEQVSYVQKTFGQVIAEAFANAAVEALSEIIINTFENIAVPAIRKWWETKGTPGAKTMWQIIRGKKVTLKVDEIHAKESCNQESIRETTIAVSPTEVVSPKFLSDEIDTVFSEYTNDMSIEEAQHHMINIVVLSIMLADEIRQLSHTCIKDTGDSDCYLEYRRVFKKLTTQQVTDSINSILRNNPALIDDKQAKNLSIILGCGHLDDGRFIPVQNNRLRDALLIEI